MRYLQNRKVFGKYKVLAEFDEETGDVPRLDDGTVDDSFDDLYIPCKGDGKIYHLERREMVAYIPSIGRAKNIIKAVPKEAVLSVEWCDGEAFIHFDVKDMDVMAKACGAKCNRKSKDTGEYIIHSPFAAINLPKPKTQWKITSSKMDAYKEITGRLDRSQIYLLNNIQKAFLNTVVAKKLKVKDIEAEIKRQQMSRFRKEFIDMNGLWDEYLEYLRKEVEKVA